MKKKIYFFIDDNIWALRQLAEEKPASIFDIPYFAMLKRIHDKYGMKVQLNLFYQTDEAYGEGVFTLAEVPDTYKAEWKANSDWLKLAYHARKEFPNFVHLNIDYDDMYNAFKDIEREVIRFAGADSFTYATCCHWLPVSKDGVRALYDCGVRLLASSHGDVFPYDPATSDLTPDCVENLMDNRKPETMCYTNHITTEIVLTSLCAYNHIPEEEHLKIATNLGYVTDAETGMRFKKFSTGTCLNNFTIDKLGASFELQKDYEFVGVLVHEQYFHEFYEQYHPDYEDKIAAMCEFFCGNGFEFFFAEEID